jgi:hypothetical protein
VTLVGITALATHCRRLRQVRVAPAVAGEWDSGDLTVRRMQVTIWKY